MSTVWLNRVLVAAEDARIDIADRGFLLADGLFETMLAREGDIVRLDAHLKRLAEGAAVLRIPLPYDTRALAQACHNVLAANGLDKALRASLRLTLTRGPAPRGVLPPKNPRPTVLITAAEAPPPPDGLTAIISKTVRRPAASPLASVKSLAYAGNILARLEAEATGADEALVLNTEGNLAEASAANVFLVEGGRLVTPPVSDGVLPGIERAAVIARAKSLEIPALEETVAPDRLQNATELFLTSSLIGVCPLTALDGRALSVGAITRRLRAIMG